MEVRGSDCQLDSVAPGHVAVDEGSDHRVVVLSKGLLQGCRDGGGVAANCKVHCAEGAKLNLAIGRSPEVESDLRPDRSGVGEDKDN